MAGCISKINGCDIKDKTARAQIKNELAAERNARNAAIAAAVSNEANARSTEIGVERERINNIVANASETGDNAELIDIRTAYNGVVHPSAGAAVRNQIMKVRAEADILKDQLYTETPLTIPAEYSGAANVEIAPDAKLFCGTRNVLNLINPLQGVFGRRGITATVEGTRYTLQGTADGGVYIALSKEITSMNELKANDYNLPERMYTVATKGISGSYFPAIAFRNAEGTGNTIQIQPIINHTTRTEFNYTKATCGEMYIYIADGTSVDCIIDIGLFINSESAVIDESVSNVNTITESGLYNLDGYMWTAGSVEVTKLTPKDNASDDTPGATVKRPMCKYQQISVNYTGATEVLDVYIPAEIGYTRVRFGNCTHDADGGLCWRILQFCAVDDDLSVRFKITQYGETEMALQIVGRDDFIGGWTHGDEIRVDGSFMLLIDGKITDVTSLTSMTEFNEIRIFEVTRMNDPADHTTHVGDHGKEYVITASGVELNQSVEWKGAYELRESYMPMLCAIRGNDTVSALQITDTYIDDGNHRMYDVGTGGFTGYPSSYKKDIRKHTLLSEKSGLTATLEIFESPNKTGAGSRLFPNANTYNKIYYAVCGATAHHTTAAGEKWRSRCKFTFQITPGTDIEY